MTFSDRAKLELDFHRVYVSGVGCFLKTTINPLVTKPTELKTALVILRADPYVVPETLLRVAAPTDFPPIFPPLPPVITRFKSATYAALAPAVGDIITMGSGSYAVPPVWTHLHAYSGAHSYTVTDATDPANLVVTPAFPDYGEGIDFYVYRPSTLTYIIPMTGSPGDGVADRDYSSGALWYFASEHYDFLGPDVDPAFNVIDLLRSQAQSIVNALNQDSYTGDSVELFE
jgi:hypothetical protein